MAIKDSFNYTENMKSIFQENFLNLKSYYCREDFAMALRDVDKSKEDAKRFRMKELEKLCKARGIEMQELIKDRKLLDEIPQRADMKEALLQSFYDIYKESYYSTDFMERIVRRLAPEYNEDTVRTAILKKFVCGAGGKFNRFNIKSVIDWAEDRLNEKQKRDLETLTENKRMELLLSKIDDTIFEQGGTELTALDILQLIQRCITNYEKDESIEFTELVLREKAEGKLEDFLKKYNLYKEELSGSEQITILSSVAVSGDEKLKDDLLKDDLVELLEKDLKKQLKEVKRITKNGKTSTYAEVYKEAKKYAKEVKRKTGLDNELMDVCRDLAEGNFRVNGKTKTYLYYFAFMFEMTVPINEMVHDADKDVVKNLFQDFYNDNLLRVLSQGYKEPRVASTLEKEPTGEGINYKNFVEVIYVYFLCRTDLDLKPGQRIDLSEKLIQECVKRAKEKIDREKIMLEKYTYVYRNNNMNVLLKKNIDEIVDYVINNYEVIVPENSGSSRIMIASEENTASDFIDEIMECLDEEFLEFDLYDEYDKKAKIARSKEDIVDSSNIIDIGRLKSLLEERFVKDIDFMKVVTALDDRFYTQNDRFNKMQRNRILMVLHILSQYMHIPISRHIIQTRMEKKRTVSVGTQLTNAITVLQNLGYDIKRVDEEKNLYCLNSDVYDDPLLSNLLKKVSVPSYVVNDDTDIILTELLVQKINFSKRITRSELMILHFNYYVLLIDDTVGIDTFPDVFEDYASAINGYLEEARYQPLSEKNIFDMYIVLILYFYLVDSNE